MHRTPSLSFACALLCSGLLFAGCAEDGGSAGADGQGSDGAAAADPSEALFDPTALLTVDIEMSEADWDAVRWQVRGLGGFLAPDCAKQPFASEFTYRPATVTVNGVKLTEVGVRKKGFVGSMSTIKPSLKIKFDKYVQGQGLLGMERLTLNNNKADSTQVRQCLVYRTFARAGVPAPRCNLAQVTVNGRSLGVYTHLESIKKPFVARHFADANGSLYEGTMSDFADGWTATFEPKTAETDPGLSAIKAVTQALALPEGEVLAALAKHVDLDAFHAFWAVETLVGHGDGYNGNRNNFYVYVDPDSGLLHFIPRGADMSLSSSSKGGKGAASAIYPIVASALSERLYALPASRAALVAASHKVLEVGWLEAELEAEIVTLAKLAAPLLAEDHFAADVDQDAALAGLRKAIAGRRAQMAAGLADLPAESPNKKGGSGSPPCFEVYGSASGTFSTTFGTQGAADAFATGSGSFVGDVDNKAVDTKQVGATVGMASKGTLINLKIHVELSKTERLVASFDIESASLVAGEQVPQGWGAAFKAQPLVIEDSGSGKVTTVGRNWSGLLELSAAGSGVGDAVAGKFSVKWVKSSDGGKGK